MRIAYIVSDFGLVSETFISDLAYGLAKSASVTILCNNYCDQTNNPSCDVKEVSFLSLSSILERTLYRLSSFCGQSGANSNYQIRLKHAQRALMEALRFYQPDVVYIDYGTVAAMAYRALIQLNIPFVVHFHGADITSALANHLYRQELAQVFARVNVMIVASNHIRRLLILEGAPPSKIQVVRLGINLDGLTPLSWGERRSLTPSIVFLGRFTPKKHPIALLEAFALVKQQVPNALLSMIGDGPELPRVQERIVRLGLKDSVRLYGALPRSKALSIVNRHWVFAQHSVTALSGDQEGFGVSLAEAAALRLPVVSTLHNGIPEQVIHRETGFLVREFDYEAMADHLSKLLLHPDLATKMGECGSERIQKLCRNCNRIQIIEETLKIVSSKE